MTHYAAKNYSDETTPTHRRHPVEAGKQKGSPWVDFVADQGIHRFGQSAGSMNPRVLPQLDRDHCFHDETWVELAPSVWQPLLPRGSTPAGPVDSASCC